MRTISTRDITNNQSLSFAIQEGLALDGGLFTPDHFPAYPLTQGSDKKYTELAFEILSLYLNEIEPETLRRNIINAYAKFDCEEVTPLTKIGKQYLLELYHGPTSAFKDVALTLLPGLFKETRSDDKDTYILTATSGDTGKAALEGFKNQPHTYISVLYPFDKVSPLQKLQMITTQGENVEVLGVDGDFDDCQRLVKKLLMNNDAGKLHSSSANSINLGRLLPQIVYYYKAYYDLIKKGVIGLGDKVNFVTPTGNFGDILAGFFAKKMGLPVAKLICASNSNKVLTDFIKTGVYDRNRSLIQTTSPSMDILVSSNLERLLFILSDYNDKEVKSYMDDLEKKGSYEIKPYLLSLIQESFEAYYCDEKESLKTLKDAWELDKRLIDPHTAVAYHAAKDFERDKVNNYPTVVLSTASTYKFPQTVLEAVFGEKKEDPFEAMDLLNKKTGVPIPANLESLKNAPIRFNQCYTIEETYQIVHEHFQKGKL